MGAKKRDISQIDKYFKGKLDAGAMHQMERAAQDDPFLMDAMEGFEKAGTDQKANLAQLEGRLANRVAKNNTRSILLWRVLPMAACLLLMLGVGYWFIRQRPDKKQIANNLPAPAASKQSQSKAPVLSKEVIVENAVPKKEQTNSAIPKNDKIDYVVSNFRVKSNQAVDELLKKMAVMEVDSNGVMAKRKNEMVVTRINGRDFIGGDIKEAVKNLPPEIADKIKVVDDYGATPSNLGKAKVLPNVYGNSIPAAALKPDYKSSTFGSVVNPAPLANNALTAGKVKISGIILDANTKEPLTGTTIGTVKDGRLTQADINGKYTVVVDAGSALTYNFVSYASQMHKLQPQENTVNINMVTDSKAAAEVVIRGYVKRDKDIANGSSYTIVNKEVKDNPVGNVEQLLQGKVAGLNIQNNTGAPGMRGSINVQGLNTLQVDSAGQRVISGTVIDATTGEPLTGATIGTVAKGGITQADINGKFKVTVPAGTDVLTVAFVSYEPKLVKLGSNNDLRIAMNTNHKALSEVVIRGYVKRNREQTTGSSYIITGKEVQDKQKLSKIPGRFFLFEWFRKKTPGECLENESFKKRFFEKIDLVEKYVTAAKQQQQTNINKAKFISALKFIAKYTPVSADLKGNTGYANIEAFKWDKANWLNWYETNKCINAR